MIKITENHWAFIEVELEFLKTLCICKFSDEMWSKYIEFRKLLKEYMKVSHCDWKQGEKQKLREQINKVYLDDIMLQSIMQSGIRYVQMIKTSNVGTHSSHCCKKHGCKYGDDDCPVHHGHIIQDYPCERCSDPHELFMAAVEEMCNCIVLESGKIPSFTREKLKKLIEARNKYYQQGG